VRARRTDPEKLRDLLAKRRMSNKVFGELLKYRSASMVQYILSGDRDFGDDRAARAAEILGCAIEDFTVPLRTPTGRTPAA
jgi:hypothetical protein